MLVKSIINLVTDRGSMRTTPRRYTWEKEIGRRFRVPKADLPWVAKKDRIKNVHAVLSKLRSTKDFGRSLESPLNLGKKGRSKITLTLSQLSRLSGDAGVYMIIHLGIKSKQTEALVRMMRVLNFMGLNENDRSMLPSLHMYTLVTKTMCEIWLPIWFNTMVAHYPEHLWHANGSCEIAGNLKAIAMWTGERFQGVCKRMIKSRKNPEYSIMKGWIVKFVTGLESMGHDR